MKKLIVALMGASAALLATGAMAADLYQPSRPAPAAEPYYNSSAFDFEGFYAGIYGGGLYNGAPAGVLGGVAGVNFELAPAVLGGVEVQAGGIKGGGALTGEAHALGRLGVILTDEVMLYGAAGAGIQGGTPVYDLGGGMEVAVGGPASIRGEVLGVGNWGAAPNQVRGTLGVLWHMN